MYPHARRNMSLDELRGEDKSKRNINPRHTTRQIVPDFLDATSHNQTTGKAFRRTATVMQENSPGPSNVTLPSFQESFPDELCGPSSLARYPCPTNSSTLPPVWSVLNLPTATFAWPQIKPASKMHRKPCLYMDLSVKGSFTPNSTLGRLDSRLATQTFDKRPLSSYSSGTSSTNSLDMASHCPAINNALSNTYSSTQQQDILASTHPARKTNPRTSGVLRTPKSKRFQTFEHGESPDNQFQMSASTDAWQTLSKEVDGPDGEPFYTCLGVKKDGVDCHYWAGKQAMKRHVEATHLGIKRHSCSYCTKAFSQKTALQVHEATHTSAKPLECRYQCGEMFSDPGRRHKHYVNAHDYIPKQSKKKSRALSSYPTRRVRNDGVPSEQHPS